MKKVTGQALMSPAEVYASTVNSIVSINCSAVSTNIFGQRVESASSGSGFVITQDGYIVTNHHVISGASSVTVTMYDGTEYPATVVGSDSDYDVAVLKIDATGLQPVTLGSSEDVNVGDTVLAIGNPLGELTFSMSQGIVSCCDRAINVDGTPFNMIQVDASINPGNSGGPLMNLYGEGGGIVSAKYSSYSDTTVEGLGFAIPIGDVQAIITDIMENGQITNKPSFGITAGTMTNYLYRKKVEEAREEVIQGIPLSEPLLRDNLFPPMVGHMTKIGEETGQIEDMLNRLADYYDEEVEMTTQTVMAVLEPLIILVLAAIVCVLIAAVMAPMLSMYQNLDNI